MSQQTIEYISRLLLACFLGLLIGVERSFRRKEAGVRTHALFCLGSALFMILSKYGFVDCAHGADPTMIACQIVMGFNFLAAGVIFRDRNQLASGLTTAAGLWATIAVGMACGAGMKTVAAGTAALLIGLQYWIHRYNIAGAGYPAQEIRITFKNTPAVWSILSHRRRKHRIKILEARYRWEKEGNLVYAVLQTRSPKAITAKEAFELYDRNEEILEISV